MEEKAEPSTNTQLFQLADRILGLISLVIGLLFVIVFGLLLFYGYLILQPQGATTGSAEQMKELILGLWSQVAPNIGHFARLVAPLFVLLFALGVLHKLGKGGATPFDSSKLWSDLPSALALLIIATICLLPLAGLEVPGTLNNIALVVVGFYFGKRKADSE